MNSILRFAALALAASLPSVSMTTCLDIEYSVTLLPDGSGKFVLTATGLADESKPPEPDRELKEILDLTGQTEGFAAWTEPVMKRTGKMGTFTLTGYFEDINKVKWYDKVPGEGAKVYLSYELLKAGKGGTLRCVDAEVEKRKLRISQAVAKDETSTNDDRYWVTLRVPGKITGSKGFTEMKDRVAMIRIDDKLIFSARQGDEGASRIAHRLDSPMTLAWATTDMPESEIATFRKEFDAARETWKALKARYEKLRRDLKTDKND